MPTEKLKVLHVIARFNIGGTARYLGTLLPDLEVKDSDPKLLVGGVQRGEVEDSSLANLSFTRIESLGRRIDLIADTKSYFRIRRIIKEYEPHLIHSHTFKAGLLCRLMYFGIPKVHTFHSHLLTDPEFSKLQLKAIVGIEKILAIFTKKIIVTGWSVATDLLSVGVGVPNQYVSIPGESRLTDLLPREAARKNLRLGNEFTILWSARVAPVKNPRLLVQVAELMPDCKFLMAGDGIELDAISKSAPPNLIILGFVDIKDIVMAGDVFLSTSLNEGIPYSVLEAQSGFLPVVAIKAGAISEIVEDAINGYLVAPDAEEIVDKLQKLRLNSELIERMKSNLRAASSNKLPGTSFSDKHVELYREVLNRN